MIDFDQVKAKMGSSEFRKQYAALTEPTAVYVNGHYIGTWVPFALNDLAWKRAVDAEVAKAPDRRFVNESSFRPVPKPSRRGKVR